MGGLGLVADRRALVAPAAVLLAVTLAVVLFHSSRHQPAQPPRPHQPTRPPAPLPRRYYRVVRGDTLTAIATKTRVPSPRLRVLNPALQPTTLFIGERIRVR